MVPNRSGNRTKTNATLGMVAAIVAALYVVAARQGGLSPSSVSRSTEIEPVSAAAEPTPDLESIPSALKQERPDAEKPLPVDRAAETRRAMVALMAAWRDTAAGALAQRGLAPEDSARLAQAFSEGVADCFLDVIHRDFGGSSGNDELTWTRAFAYANLNRVQAAATPCVVNIGQQAGIQIDADFGTVGRRADDIPPESPSPPWAADMERRIRDHVASHSAPGIETVLVRCSQKGCQAALAGRDIHIFDLEFDVFAERNGFQSVSLSGDANMRFVWLPRD